MWLHNEECRFRCNSHMSPGWPHKSTWLYSVSNLPNPYSLTHFTFSFCNKAIFCLNILSFESFYHLIHQVLDIFFFFWWYSFKNGDPGLESSGLKLLLMLSIWSKWKIGTIFLVILIQALLLQLIFSLSFLYFL